MFLLIYNLDILLNTYSVSKIWQPEKNTPKADVKTSQNYVAEKGMYTTLWSLQ